MKESLQQLLAQARTAFEKLSARERQLVLGAGGVLGVLLLYLAIWEPLINAHARRAEALESARAMAVRIETAAALVQSRGGAQAQQSGTLLSVIDQSSREPTLGKAPSRIQPDGAGEKTVKVWIDDVPFDKLMRWLGELETRYGVRIASAEIGRGGAPGLVNVQLSLVR